MSYHLVHILTHQSRLYIDRGCLVCEIPPDVQKRIPVQDTMGIIVAARGISFSSDCISTLIENGGFILHCNEKYQPIAKTVGLHKVIHSEIFEKQLKLSSEFSRDIWNKLLKAKIENQAFLLDNIGAKHKLWDYLEDGNIDEGNAARHYWKFYFSKFGRRAPKQREHKDAGYKVNQMLNYSYAVMGAIVHRSAVGHGLNPSLGVHHKFRFRTDPLVYDLLEPLRPICDFMLLRYYLENQRKPIEDYIKYVAKDLTGLRVKINAEKTLKLIYSVDRYISSVADCFYCGVVKSLFIPVLNEIIIDE